MAMVTADLQFTKLDVEAGDEVLEYVSTFGHQFSCLLISQGFLDVLFGSLEVRKEQNEDFLWIPWNFYQVDDLIYHVEVAVENLARHFYAFIIITDRHRRRPLFGNNVNFIRTATVQVGIL